MPRLKSQHLVAEFERYFPSFISADVRVRGDVIAVTVCEGAVGSTADTSYWDFRSEDREDGEAWYTFRDTLRGTVITIPHPED